MQSLACEFCGKLVNRYPSGINSHNFCSVLCRNRWLNLQRVNKILKFCLWCGKQVSVPRSHGTRVKYCSKVCRANWESKYRRGILAPRFGRSHTEETKRVISVRTREKSKSPWLGKHLPIEVKAKLSTWAKAFYKIPEHRARLREIGLKGLKSQFHKPNRVELQLLKILNRYSPGEWKYTGDGSHTIGGFPVDFTNCNGYKAVIELFGDYWHNRQRQKWHQSELGRIMAYNSLGFRCLVIWEHEIKDELAVVAKVKQFMET